MSYKAGTRYSNDTYIMTETTAEGVSAVGEINGEPVEFSGGGSGSEYATVTVVLSGTENVPYIEFPFKITALTPDGSITGAAVSKLVAGENTGIILDEGKAMTIVDAASLSGITLTGDDNIDVQSLGPDNLVIVTGDGTLTCSYVI